MNDSITNKSRLEILPLGSLVALVTPMQPGNDPDTAIDYAAFDRLIEWHIECGTQGIVIAGTTGESATLAEEEHCVLIQHAVKKAAQRIMIIAGTGANSTTEALRLTQSAQQSGADACLLVTPYYNKPTQEGMYQHYRLIAEAVDIPQLLYNVPVRTACDLLPETVSRLAPIDNIIGIKEASNDLNRVSYLRSHCGENFVLLSGEDASAAEFVLHGGDGVISVTANVVPKKMRQLCDIATTGDHVAAKQIDQVLQPLHKDLFIEPNPITVKWCLNKMRLIQPGIRMPLTWLSKEHEAAISGSMQGAGIALP